MGKPIYTIRVMPLRAAGVIVMGAEGLESWSVLDPGAKEATDDVNYD